MINIIICLNIIKGELGQNSRFFPLINKEKINKTISFEHYLDFEYLINILHENHKKLLFLGNKRNYHENNQFNSQNKNIFHNFKYNNYNFLGEYNKKEINNQLINHYLESPNNIINNSKIYAKNKCKENEINITNNNNNINLIEEELFGNHTKVIKHKKTVYVNKLALKEKDIIKKNKRNGNARRSSKYRGVSKNGIGWQTLMMCKNNKPYIGTYNSEELAARIYDIVSIKKNGIKSKTNFVYNKEQIERILKTNINFRDQNISKVISELIN